MHGKTHLWTALALTSGPAVIVAHLDPSAGLAALGTGAVCGLGPDVDEPRSTISHWLRMATLAVGLGVAVIFLLQLHLLAALAAPAIAVVIGWIRPFRHRGPTHSLLAAAVVAVAAYALAALEFGPASCHAALGPCTVAFSTSLTIPMLFAAIAGGCWCLHLAEDLTNVAPVALWWPLRKPTFGWRWLSAREGSTKGNIEEGIAVVAATAWMGWIALSALGLQASLARVVGG